MKPLLILLLCSLAIGRTHAQQTLPGDTLAADFHCLVQLLEETHPDPYTGFGGKVFFRKAAFDLENRLKQSSATLQSFHEQVTAFLSHLQDGHTYLSDLKRQEVTSKGYFPAVLRVISDGLIAEALPRAYSHLLGSRVTAIEGDSLEQVLDRVALLQACENRYHRCATLKSYFALESFQRQLFPQLGDSLHLTLLTPDNETRRIALPLLPTREEVQKQLVRTPEQNGFPQGQLEYKYVDAERQVMGINIDAIMARDNFEYMYRQHWTDLGRQLSFYYQRLGREMPADTLQAIEALPSFSDTFARMLEEMKRDHAHTLIIDLRGNSGGWTPIARPTLYQLYGSRLLDTDMETQTYRLVSPLLLQKYGISGRGLRQGDRAWQVGEYTFTPDEADTTNYPLEERCRMFVQNAMSSVPDKLEAQHGEAVYTPQHVYVVTDATTFSAAFHYAFFLWKMGATVVGVPSRQAPNTFMEQTPFRLPRTGLTGSISNCIQIFLPGNDRRAKTFYPDWMPTYEDYRKYGFDKDAELLYLLERIGKENR